MCPATENTASDRSVEADQSKSMNQTAFVAFGNLA